MKAKEMSSDNQPMKDQLLEAAREIFLLQDNEEVYTHFYNCFAYEKYLLHQVEFSKNNIPQIIDDLDKFVFETGLYQEHFFPNDVDKQRAIALGQEMARKILSISKIDLQDDLIRLQERFKKNSVESQRILNLVNNSDPNEMRKTFEKQFQIIDCVTIQGWYQDLAEILNTIKKQLLSIMTYQENSPEQYIKQVDFSPLHSEVTNILMQLPRGALSSASHKKKEKKERPRIFSYTINKK